MNKHMQTLVKDLDFETQEDYFNYMIDSLINGQKKQLEDLFNELHPDDQVSYFNEFLDDNTLYTRELIKEARNICIDQVCKNNKGLSITLI